MTRRAWGQGKHEIEILKPEIIRLVQEGKSQTAIYEKLTSEGKLKATPRTFQRYAPAIRKEALAAALPDQQSKITTPSSQAPKPEPSLETSSNAAAPKKTITHNQQRQKPTFEHDAEGADLDELFHGNTDKDKSS